jgi:hypothetical protein
MALLLLSPRAVPLARALPAEEIYQMVKEVGEEDALPVLAVATPDQMQYIFDVEWWQGDKFKPQRAFEWLSLFDQANDQMVYQWFLTEDFDQKVMALQSLIRVEKAEEGTDPLEEETEQPHFTPDGVFYIFFKIAEAESLLKKVFKLLYSQEPRVLNALLEAVIWYQVTPTVEAAYRWWSARTEEKGIPPYDEAVGIYSMMRPEELQMQLPTHQDFSEVHGDCLVPPGIPLEEIDPSTFLGQCLAMMKHQERFDTICWEVVYLANKVMVADKMDLSDLESRRRALRKALGYINIGLELGAGGDIAKGEKLLAQTWMQSLFQVGHSGLLRLKWEAEKLVHDNGRFLEQVLPQWSMDHLAAIVGRFPKIAVAMKQGDEEDPGAEIQWKDLESLQDIQILENFLIQSRFYVRFSRQCLDLSEAHIEALAKEMRYPEQPEDLDQVHFFTTALARHVLFGSLSCEPLHEEGARSFLQKIFKHPIPPSEGRVVDEEKIIGFRDRLLVTSLAWTPVDRELLNQLMVQCVQNLETQFGRLDFKGNIDWKFTRGLIISK